jgi:hypothetical protein
MRQVTFVLMILVCLAPVALADIIELKGGGTVEGEILSESAESVLIKTRYGKMDIPRARIAKITRSKSVRQEYEDRLLALKADDAEGHFQLALWAKSQGLRKESSALVEKAAEIDPMHAGANEALGRVLFEGRYVTPEERESILRGREDDEMGKRGLVRYKDRWVTPEEKSALERGLVKHEGRWMTPDEKKKAQGFVRYKGEWIHEDDLERLKDLDRFRAVVKGKLEAIDTPHFRFFTVYPEAQTRKVAEACERVYDQFFRVFDLAEGEKVFHRAKCRVFLFRKAIYFDRFMDWFGPEMELEPARVNLIRQNRGTYYIYPEPYIAGYQFPDPFEQLMGRTVHKVGHIMIHGWKYDGEWMPWWITEGLGAYWEIAVLGRCDTYFITIRDYGNMGDSMAEKWRDSEDWKVKLKGIVGSRRDPSLVDIRKKTLNEIGHVELAKSWSVVDWLIARHRKEFIEFILLMKRGEKQDDAARKAFGKNWREMDKEWREYVSANY